MLLASICCELPSEGLCLTKYHQELATSTVETVGQPWRGPQVCWFYVSWIVMKNQVLMYPSMSCEVTIDCTMGEIHYFWVIQINIQWINRTLGLIFHWISQEIFNWILLMRILSNFCDNSDFLGAFWPIVYHQVAYRALRCKTKNLSCFIHFTIMYF